MSMIPSSTQLWHEPSRLTLTTDQKINSQQMLKITRGAINMPSTINELADYQNMNPTKVLHLNYMYMVNKERAFKLCETNDKRQNWVRPAYYSSLCLSLCLCLSLFLSNIINIRDTIQMTVCKCSNQETNKDWQYTWHQNNGIVKLNRKLAISSLE